MTRGRILTDREREYLKDRRVWPNRRMRSAGWERAPPDRDVKHRIHHKAGRQLRDIVRKFRLDLHAIDEYYKSERPGDWYGYSSVTLPHTKDELEELRGLIDKLIQRAESETRQEEKTEIREALEELAVGLPHVQAVASNEFEAMDEADIQWEDNDIVGPPEFLEEDEEFRARQKALMAVLSDEGLFEIFTWVCEHGGDVNAESNIKEREKSNSAETWKQALGRYLISKHGLVAKQRWEYELTERGECVQRAMKGLLDSDAATERANSGTETEGDVSGLEALEAALENSREIDERQAAANLLSHHFSADQWI